MIGRGSGEKWTDRLIRIGALAALCAAGCSSTGERAGKPRPVSLAAFARPVETLPPAEVPMEPVMVTEPGEDMAPAAVEDDHDSGEIPASTGIELGATSVDEPEPVDGDTEAAEARSISEAERVYSERMIPGDRLIVDSLVGQVNGRPIFADDFFLPIEDRLIAEADGCTQREYTYRAKEIVDAELRDVVQNALFLAEAESALSPEQQQGLLYWIKQMQEQVVSDFGGTEAVARGELQKEGTTLESYMRDRKDRALIENLIQAKIQPKVIVSWRDIETEYKRHYDEYHPKGMVSLARIRLTTERQAEGIIRVMERLAAGEEFMEVADSLNSSGAGEWQEFEMGPGGLSEIEGISNEIMIAEVTSLTGQGDTAGPFEIGSTTWWIHITEFDQPQSRSLYDPQVQRELRSAIQNARSLQEQYRYFNSLLEEGIYDELEAMSERLLLIAVLRYGPS